MTDNIPPSLASHKALIIVDQDEIRVYHTDQVEVACIVDGEDVTLPDDWTELPHKVVHYVPITVRSEEIFADDSGAPPPNIVLEPGIFVEEATTEVSHEPPQAEGDDALMDRLADAGFRKKRGRALASDFLPGEPGSRLMPPPFLQTPEEAIAHGGNMVGGSKKPNLRQKLTGIVMKRPYCEECDANHRPGEHIVQT